MNIDLQDKQAWVFGASAGIGRAIAIALANAGATVIGSARTAGRLNDVVAQLPTPRAQKHRAVLVDLENLDDVRAAAHAQVQHGVVHILVNNAAGPAPGPILEARPEDFIKAMTRHVFAAHLLTQALVPAMTVAQFGRIINIVSTSVREPLNNLGVSNTTRGATASWAKTLAKELPPSITINNILPGFTETDRLEELRAFLAKTRGSTRDAVNAGWVAQVPCGRIAEPSEIAAAAVFLASPQASYIRGVSLAVDGGRMASI